MRHFDLFSGIGGFALGLQWAGRYDTVGFCEIEPYCQRVLAKNFPAVPIYSDIRILTYDRLAADGLVPIDILTGGFPCQPVSIAGAQRGAEDARWLWPEFARLIGETRPRWVLAENVPGLRTVAAGRLFGSILRDLAHIGYAAEWYSLGAADLGAWHKRGRIWLVAYPECSQWRAHHLACKQKGQDVLRQAGQKSPIEFRTTGAAVSNTTPLQRSAQQWHEPYRDVSDDGEDADAASKHTRYPHHGESPRLAQCLSKYQRRFAIWDVEPAVGRVAHGIPHRVDRLRGLGNAIVPQIAQLFGEAIVTVEKDV